MLSEGGIIAGMSAIYKRWGVEAGPSVGEITTKLSAMYKQSRAMTNITLVGITFAGMEACPSVGGITATWIADK